MSSVNQSRTYAVASLLLCSIGCGLSVLEYNELSFAIICTATLCTIFGEVGRSKDWLSPMLLFVVFTGIYSVAGPLGVLSGVFGGKTFTPPFHLSEYLTCASVAIAGVSASMLPCVAGFRSPDVCPHRRSVAIAGVVIASLSSAMCAYEFVSMGGGTAFALTKAQMQEYKTEYIPYSWLMFGGAATIGLEAGVYYRNFKKVAPFVPVAVLVIFPFVALSLLRGERGDLLFLGLISLFTLTRGAGVAIPRKTMFFGAVFLYASLSAVGAIRASVAYQLGTGDQTRVASMLQDPAWWRHSLHPATGEFAAPYGNFNEYVKAGEPREVFGNTYLESLAYFIPRAIYPGEKPERPTYTFRRIFLPEQEVRGKTAGTAFSGILEAHIAVPLCGPFLLFMLLGLLFRASDRVHVVLGFRVSVLMSALLLPVTQLVVRSDFAAAAVLSSLNIGMILVIIAPAAYRRNDHLYLASSIRPIRAAR